MLANGETKNIAGVTVEAVASYGESFNPLIRYPQLTAVYPHHDPDMASSHNDLKPDNLLFDGHRHGWWTGRLHWKSEST